MIYHFSDIAKITRGTIVHQSDDPVVQHLLTDSRKLVFPNSSIFFALHLTGRNGHDFIEDLVKQGLRNFVVSEDISHPDKESFNIIKVADTLAALQLVAANHRNQFQIPVIAITGSNGKTVVKEWLNELLEDRYRIVRSPRSYNSQTGVPLSVWQMNESHELAIFEAGISRPDEMGQLQKIIRPEIGIFTNIGEAHSEGFVNLRSKVNEKLHLFTQAKIVIYRRDYHEINEGIAALLQQLRKGSGSPFSIFDWSTVSAAKLRVTAIRKTEDHSTIEARYEDRNVAIEIPFSDEASIENAIHCWCLMLHLGIEDVEIALRMKRLSPVAMRLELIEGKNNSSIINDSYNADLSSLSIALDFLQNQQQHPKRTVILTDILQSGFSESNLYQRIAELIQKKKVNRLFAIGKAIGRNQSVFNSVPSLESHFYDSMDEFKSTLPDIHFSNETILLKGARIFGLEQVSQLLEQKIHQTVLEIDLNAVAHNLREWRKLLKPETKIMAMVKAFSYGSGSFEIASVLQFHKADYLAVAYADEGIQLRKAGITLPVMVMNTDSSAFEALLEYNLEPDIFSLPLLKEFDVFLKKQGVQSFPVHIELETGMNRLGFSESELPGLLDGLKSSRFAIRSVFTHLAASEDSNFDVFTRQQASRFRVMAERIQEVVQYPFIRHICNSSGIARHPDLQLDMVRLGIGLYGIDSQQPAHVELQEISTLKTTIAQIKHIAKGETVGYGRKGVVEQDKIIATVRIGYADGYPRELGNGHGKMWVKGRLAPVIGSVCMDMTMIDITGIEGLMEGDEVIVFGGPLSASKLAAWAGTIPYDILTGVSQRVKRVYYQE